MSKGPQDVVNYAKLELWVIAWDFSDTPTFKKDKGRKPYLLMSAVMPAPTIKGGANFWTVVCLDELAEKIRDMNLKKGDHVLIEGRVGYKYSSRAGGRQYRLYADNITVLPPEEMPLYDYQRNRKHPLDVWPSPDLADLKEKRQSSRSVIVKPEITDPDDDEVPF